MKLFKEGFFNFLEFYKYLNILCSEISKSGFFVFDLLLKVFKFLLRMRRVNQFYDMKIRLKRYCQKFDVGR